jgi:hypothetical protein
MPTMTEARHIEVEFAGAGLAAEIPNATKQRDDALIEHEEMMRQIMRARNAEDDADDE